MKKILLIIKKAFNTLADCIVPILPIMIGVGMIKVLLILVGPTVLGLITEDTPTYIVLQFVADAGFYFLPIFVGFSSAGVFKTNQYLGALVGAMLISPAFVELVDNGTELTFLKLPIASTNYGNQILSSVIAVWIMSYVYNYLNQFIFDKIRTLLLPLLTILIMIPIAFCAIGPIGIFLGNLLVELIMFLKNIGPIGNGIMCSLILFVVLTGLSGANLSAMLLLASTGCDPILFFSNVIFNNVVGFVTLATYLKNKNSETLAAAITSSVAGTSEPAVYGTIVKDIKSIIAVTVGCFFGGLYAGLTGVKSFAMASFGIFGAVTTIGPGSSIINATIAIIIGSVIGFAVCLLLHQKDHE